MLGKAMTMTSLPARRSSGCAWLPLFCTTATESNQLHTLSTLHSSAWNTDQYETDETLYIRRMLTDMILEVTVHAADEDSIAGSV